MVNQKTKQELAEDIETLSQRIGMLTGALVEGCDADFWFAMKAGIVRDVGEINYQLDRHLITSVVKEK